MHLPTIGARYPSQKLSLASFSYSPSPELKIHEIRASFLLYVRSSLRFMSTFI